ncbi:MAG: hypothetical protein HON94_13900 [Methylococcales bacterium]|jgi:chemotaxis protein MotA|nr:hypothetical protein [Methylococcales bacterium]MBT7411092.1 hypothetical protein [Methylococcales bacterium]
MKISIGTILGILTGFGLFVFAVISNTDNYLMFFSLSSLLMVIGGSFAATFIAFHERYVFRSMLELFKILVPSNISPKSLFQDVEKLITWSNVVRRKGLTALEMEIDKEEEDDTFLVAGSRLLVSNYKGEELNNMLQTHVDSTYERNHIKVSILQYMANVAPAFGMIGTLVGLIIMLDNMGGDPSGLGAGLAVALLTTLYGVLFAQLLFKPAAAKLKQKEQLERFRNTLIMQGLVLMAEQTPPAKIEDSLNCFLDPNLYFNVAERD